MKTILWTVVLSVVVHGILPAASAQTSRVEQTINENESTLKEQIREKRQQIEEAEIAIDQLQQQIILAQSQTHNSGTITIKRVFMATAAVSLVAIFTSKAKLEGTYPLVIPVPGRGFFYGILGLLGSGAGYIATDVAEIFLTPAQTEQLNAELVEALTELNVLKRQLNRLESQN